MGTGFLQCGVYACALWAADRVFNGGCLRAIGDVLAVEYDRAVRFGRPLSLLMALRPDMPLGLGPEALEQAHAAVRSAVRSYDSSGVVEGPSLIIVLPETDAAGAHTVAERLRAELAYRNGGRRVWRVLELPGVETFGSAGQAVDAVLRLASRERAA